MPAPAVAPSSSYTLPRRVVGVRFEGEAFALGAVVAPGAVVGAAVAPGSVVGAAVAPGAAVGATEGEGVVGGVAGQPVRTARDRVPATAAARELREKASAVLSSFFREWDDYSPEANRRTVGTRCGKCDAFTLAKLVLNVRTLASSCQ